MASDMRGFPQQCRYHATRQPDQPAIIEIADDGTSSVTTWAALNDRIEAIAALLSSSGVDAGSLVVVSLPDGVDHCVTCLAVWKLGACVLPISPRMPVAESAKQIALGREWRPLLFVGDVPQAGADRALSSAQIAAARAAATPIPDGPIPVPGKMIGSGGSTGRPKLIVDPNPWARVPGQWGLLTEIGFRPGQTQLVIGRLYHNLGFLVTHAGLFEGHTLIMTRRFDPVQSVQLIEQYQVQFAAMLPIHIQRIVRTPGVSARQMQSIECMYHSGAACPDWAKRRLLELIEPRRVWDLYGSTEEIGLTMIHGDQWLQRPGSVGRAYRCEVKIVDDNSAQEIKDGRVGEIFMRRTHNPFDPNTPLLAPQYIGAAPLSPTPDGFLSVGDLGRLDADGWLYLSDRRVDMIKSGGALVYPAEVEAVLSEFPGIADVVVVGLPDAEWGHRIHAIIQPSAWPHAIEQSTLESFCRSRLLSEKLPRSFEWVRELPRDASGKIRRALLRDARSDSA